MDDFSINYYATHIDRLGVVRSIPGNVPLGFAPIIEGWIRRIIREEMEAVLKEIKEKGEADETKQDEQ